MNDPTDPANARDLVDKMEDDIVDVEGLADDSVDKTAEASGDADRETTTGRGDAPDQDWSPRVPGSPEPPD